MKKRRQIRLLVLFTGLMASAGYSLGFLFTSNAQPGRVEPSNPTAERIARQIPGRDLRVKPPQVIEFKGEVLRRPASQGNMLLKVRFAKEEHIQQTIEIMIGEKPVTFRDDGRNGDERSGDGIHSGITTMSREELALERKRQLSLVGKDLPIFRGRELVDKKRINRDVLTFRPGIEFDLFPAGDPANVNAAKSLMVTDPTVVQDPSRTRTACGTSGSMGKWSFGYLMTEMANEPVTGINPSQFVKRWLERWKVNQTVNDFVVTNRAGGINPLIANWPKNADGSLDLSRAPMRLVAIVNRLDLRGSFGYGGGGTGNGGELRFVFAILDPVTCSAQNRGTVIFEYGVRKTSCASMKGWAQQWKALDAFVLGSVDYNNGLEAITEQIVKRNSDPLKTNGSALNQLRTNELIFGSPWELREFRVMPMNGGHLEAVTVKQTPDIGFNNNATLASYVNGSESEILTDRHTVPLNFPGMGGASFLGGSAPVPGNNTSFVWENAGITNLEARHHFSLNTCNSCHAGETSTQFLHVGVVGFAVPPSPPPVASLSRFLTGNTPDITDNEFFVFNDPRNAGVTHQFNDLLRRATDMDALINSPCKFNFALVPNLMVH